jgi:hypothetical protein
MIAIPALPGPDGELGTDDDIPDPDGEPRIRWIPTSVLDALTALTLPQTAGGLLELANLCFAGENTEGASPTEINQAVSAVNELFDGCALIVACERGEIWSANVVADHTTEDDVDVLEGSGAPTSGVPADFEFSVTSPINRSSMISFNAPERSRVDVAVFDAGGRIVMKMEDRIVGAGYNSFPLGIERVGRMSAGVYFVRVQVTGMETGRRFGRAQKMIVLR